MQWQWSSTVQNPPSKEESQPWHHIQMLIGSHSLIPPNLHNLQSLEMCIQHDNHHVVNLMCIKRPQEIQKRFDHLYNLKLHISM
jgi:hypothetical protein